MVKSKLKLIPEDTLEIAVNILKAFAHPGCLQIMNILLNGEYYFSEVQKATDIKGDVTINAVKRIFEDGCLTCLLTDVVPARS